MPRLPHLFPKLQKPFWVFLTYFLIITILFLIQLTIKLPISVTIGAKRSHPQLFHPTDIIYFQGHYVTTELLTNRLAFFDNLDFKNIQHFDPKAIQQTFTAPHHLAISPSGSLLISSGWGQSIVEIQDLQGKNWKEFRGIGQEFKAPHGICVDRNGWIYVGDSLNSRLVRFKDMTGKDWEVFKDIHKKVSYIRQLICQDGVIWASNSYEGRPGLNPGTGANVLKITDFASGEVEEVFTIPDSNITGILPLGQLLLIGLWGGYQQLGFKDLSSGEFKIIPNSNFGFGAPYGMFYDPQIKLPLATYFGSFEDKTNQGGIVELEIKN